MSTRDFIPTTNRPIRDGADPVRSIVVAWDDESPGLATAVSRLTADAARGNVRIVVVSDHPEAASTVAAGVEHVPTRAAGESDETARRRIGLTHTDGDVTVFVTERTRIPDDWTTQWFGGLVRDS